MRPALYFQANPGSILLNVLFIDDSVTGH